MYFFRRISDSNRSTHSNVGLFDSLQQLISGQTKIPVYLTHTLDDFDTQRISNINFSVPSSFLFTCESKIRKKIQNKTQNFKFKDRKQMLLERGPNQPLGIATGAKGNTIWIVANNYKPETAFAPVSATISIHGDPVS